jgi:hypothetical protein
VKKVVPAGHGLNQDVIAMYTDIQERIVVAMECGGSPRMRPLWFTYKRRKIPIKAVNYTWEGKEGRASIYFFAVSDTENNVYELCFNSETMEWRLSRVFCEG